MGSPESQGLTNIGIIPDHFGYVVCNASPGLHLDHSTDLCDVDVQRFCDMQNIEWFCARYLRDELFFDMTIPECEEALPRTPDYDVPPLEEDADDLTDCEQTSFYSMTVPEYAEALSHTPDYDVPPLEEDVNELIDCVLNDATLFASDHVNLSFDNVQLDL